MMTGGLMWDPWHIFDIFYYGDDSPGILDSAGSSVSIDDRHADYPWLMSIRYAIVHGVIELIGAAVLFLLVNPKSPGAMMGYVGTTATMAYALAHLFGAVGLHQEKQWVASALLGLLALETFTLLVAMGFIWGYRLWIHVYWAVGAGVLFWFVFCAIFLVKTGKRLGERAKKPGRKGRGR